MFFVKLSFEILLAVVRLETSANGQVMIKRDKNPGAAIKARNCPVTAHDFEQIAADRSIAYSLCLLQIFFF